MAGGFGTVNTGAATGCGIAQAPVRGFFGFNNLWIWIIIFLVLIIFLFPGILSGFRLGGFAI